MQAHTPATDATLSSLPEGLEVTFRRMDFGLDEEVPRYWADESPCITHFFNSLSVHFPEGERFFVDSVRYFESELRDPKLRREVKAFIAQEAHHSHQHRVLDRLMSRHGTDLVAIEDAIGRMLGLFRRFAPKRIQLAATICLEHFTAILANQLLTNPRNSEIMHPKVRSLWVWHAMEETEHKAVAFDVYRAIGASDFQRRFMMARMMFGFPFSIWIVQSILLWRDGRLFDARDWLHFWRWAYGRGGFMRAIWPELKDFFRRDFHPWDVQNQHLISEWEAAQAESRPA